ncbi:hypothetical protein L9F63_004085 [Diploptera punctata]|uniref:CBM21 domain-containing protein n=1 Tax=Diploptera punctata TaxID=6984 RepID=A0AAD8E891_DIPPU|nr:hypothetical protein L9F63_004085 [Diploptera punctata]
MTTEHQACGLGSFLPMSYRGRAEAFARRLQSRLQSLGRAGSGDGASSPDESSWSAGNPDVTSDQPCYSSSSDSDIYFDFDLDCESPGSPENESNVSENLPDYILNESRAFHCPPKTQYSSESGCVLSPSTMTGNSPGSDSSDGQYFDPDTSDSEIPTIPQNNNSENDNSEIKHQFHLESVFTQESLQTEPTVSENGSHGKMNGYSAGPYGERKLILRRNFRNAAGFRISSPEKEIKSNFTDSSENPSNSVITVNTTRENHNEGDNCELLSNESSTDEYFECSSLKSEESISENLNSITVHDSGYPNTTESSRCNSQNETRLPQLELAESEKPEHEITNENSYAFVDNILESKENTDCSLDSKDSGDDAMIRNLEETVVSSSSGFSSVRPCNLKLDCSASSSEFADVSKDSFETGKKNDDDDDDDDKTIPRVRRCSSLKTGKTPPGTPSRKKIVRFADVLGLDLADVRTFLDEIPKVPRSAYEDLACADIPDASSSTLTEVNMSNVLPTCIRSTVKSERCLIPLFQQPGGQPDFMDRIREDQVCLENALVTDTISFTISGTVRVRNLDFHKSVHIRYTLDGWKTFADLQAIYIQNSCDGFSDKFTFTLYAHTVQVGQRLEFAVRFQCRGSQYWDSNRGANYVFQCLPPTDCSSSYAPIPISPIEQYPSSFY